MRNRIFIFDENKIKPDELNKIMAAISRKFPNANIVAIPKCLKNVDYNLSYLKSVVKVVNECIAQLEAKESEVLNG